MGPAELAVAIVSAGFGFVLADGLDRMLATYDPGATGDKPKDKFTSDGTGALANALNVGAMPDWKRVVTGVAVTAVPAVGSMFIENKLVRSSVEGLAVGAGVSLFKTLWNNVLMPMLIGKDTTTPTLQKSYIARLYPAEVAASINKRTKDDKGQPITPQMNVSSAGSGALSGQQADVGPFALGGDSPYQTAEQAIRSGVSGDSPYPTAADALRTGVHGDSPYPTAAQALRKEAGVSAWQPGPPTSPGPGPQAEPHTDPSCGCIGDPTVGFSAFLGTPEEGAAAQ
jgi:hypothetical protein